MIYRKISNDEAIDFARLSNTAFYSSTENARKRIDDDKFQTPDIRCVFNDDVMVAGLRLIPFQMNINGTSIKCGGIGDVASYPEYRKQGNISYLMKNAIDEMYNSDYVISYLYPFSHPFYGKYGYASAHDFIFYDIPTDELIKYDKKCTAKQYIPDSTDDILDDLIHVYDKYAKKYNLMINREHSRWKALYNDHAYDSEFKTYAYYENNQPVSYIKYEYKKLSIIDIEVTVYDIAYKDTNALLNILGFMSRQLPYVKSIKINLPADMKILDILDERHNASISYEAGGMARIINVKKALETIDTSCVQTDVTIKVTDKNISANNNTLTLHTDGSVDVHDCKTADLECSIQTLTQLIVGYRSLSDLLSLNKIAVNNNSDALQTIFTSRITHIQDKF